MDRVSRVSLVREAAAVACVLVVVSGGWLCAFARLGQFAPNPFLGNAFDLINTGLAPILAGMTLAALLAGVLQRRLGLWLLAVTLAVAAWQLVVVLADAAPRGAAGSGATTLRVVTVNAFHDNPQPELLRAAVEAAAPDIVLVEEADGRASGSVAQLLPRYHRALSCSMPPCSLAILSRWPIQHLPKPMPPERDMPDALFAQISLPGREGSVRPIHVVAVHMPRGYRPVAVHFRQVLIGALRRETEMPTILAGDFNLPTGAAGLSDLVRETGLRRAERWIATYPANTMLPAFAAIDHMFVAPAFVVRACRRLPFTGSDHFAIACDLTLPP
jgi:endonuclease/exonuclease/phosphatase (EEP) superfamily protein YafD